MSIVFHQTRKKKYSLLKRIIVPSLMGAVIILLVGFLLVYGFEIKEPIFFLVGLTVCFFVIASLLRGFYQRPFNRARYYNSILEGFGDPQRLYLLTDKKNRVLFASFALLNMFPALFRKGIKAIEEELEGEDSKHQFLNLIRNAGKDKTKLASKLRFKNKYMKLWIYEFPGEGILFWRIENILPSRMVGSFLQGNEFVDRLCIETLFDYAPLGIILLDDQLKIQGYNKTFKHAFLKEQTIEIGTPFKQLFKTEKYANFLQGLQKVLQEEVKDYHGEIQFEWEEQASAMAYTSLIKQESLPRKGLLLQVFDNYEQKKLQLHLVQSQKLQALGQLAGGIAHDFNNLLTAMIGFCDLLLSRHFPGDQSFTEIMQIKQNANRAANLVRQLLAFSRQQTLQPKVLDISEALSNLSVLLQRLVGVSASLKIIHGRDLGLVKVDQGQFERVIINLVVNARDAIKENGEIIISTSNKQFDKPMTIGHETIPSGSYILVEVADNGGGISPENVSKIFDPFFSTKEIGSGTGLGLSTVYGIIKQTDGYIFADSIPHKGTKFSIFLPCYAEVSDETVTKADETKAVLSQDLTGAGRILLVEDEDAVRLFSARALRDKGYEVIEASTGKEGLKKLEEFHVKHLQKIDLLITDVVMPQMDGPTLANKALSLHKDLKIIFISGYAEDSFRRQLNQGGDIHFLPKPFSLKELAQKVKTVMGTGSQSEMAKEKISIQGL
jgi:signal transduction histidine kinase/ActR/RegA family two-component response regulator